MTTQERIAALNERDRDHKERSLEHNWASEIYERTLDETVEPGIYSVIESDQDGWNSFEQIKVEVTKPINLKELALNLYEDFGYRSPWTYLSIRKATHSVKARY